MKHTVEVQGKRIHVETGQFLEALFGDEIFPVLDEHSRVALIGHEGVPKKMWFARGLLNGSPQLEAECVVSLIEKRVPGWDIAKDAIEERQAILAAEGLPDDATSAALALVQGWQPGKDRARVLPSTEAPKKPPTGPKPSSLGLLESLPLPFRKAVARFGAEAIRQAAKAGLLVAESDGTLKRGEAA